MFAKEWQQANNKILSVSALEFFEKLFFSPRSKYLRYLKGFVFLFLSLSLVMIGGTFLFKIDLQSVLVPTLIASFIITLCLFVVYQLYLMTIVDMKEMENYILGEDMELSLLEWVKKATSIKNQLFASVLFSVFAYFAFYFIDENLGLPFNFGNVFIMLNFVTFIAGGQGVYWGFVFPSMVRELKNGNIDEIEFFTINPSQSPILKILSKWFALFSLAIALLFSSVLILLFSLLVEYSAEKILAAIVVISSGYIVGGWSFFYSHYCFSMVIGNAKESILMPIRDEITKLQSMYLDKEKDDYERISNLIDLYERIYKSPNSLLNMEAFSSLFASIISPIFVAVVWLIDLQELFDRIF